jgi:Tfp pilus assembly protein PilO
VVKAKIPNEFKDTQMSAILNRASISSGINVVDLSIKSSSSNQQSAPADINTIRPEDLIEEVKFGITLSGSYEQLLKFLDLLTKEDKIIKVKNFSIEKNSTSYDDDLISFKGEVVGFKQSVNLMSQPGVVK